MIEKKQLNGVEEIAEATVIGELFVPCNEKMPSCDIFCVLPKGHEGWHASSHHFKGQPKTPEGSVGWKPEDGQ